MTPPDSGEREVLTFLDALNVVAREKGYVVLSRDLAQRIIAALERGWDSPNTPTQLAAELRACVEGKA